MIIKGWCNGIPVTVERFPSLVGFEPKITALGGQCLIYDVKLLHHYLKILQVSKNVYH